VDSRREHVSGTQQKAKIRSSGVEKTRTDMLFKKEEEEKKGKTSQRERRNRERVPMNIRF